MTAEAVLFPYGFGEFPFGGLAAIRERTLDKKAPASTLVGVTALPQPGWPTEIEVSAVI